MQGCLDRLIREITVYMELTTYKGISHLPTATVIKIATQKKTSDKSTVWLQPEPVWLSCQGVHAVVGQVTSLAG